MSSASLAFLVALTGALGQLTEENARSLIGRIERHWCQFPEDPHNEYHWKLREHFERLGDEGREALERMLSSAEYDQKCAVAIVSVLKEGSLIPTLRALAMDKSAGASVRASSLQALSSFENGLRLEDSIALSSELDRNLIIAAIGALEQFHEEEPARSTLRQMLAREDLEEIRWHLVSVIGRMRDPLAAPVLIEMSAQATTDKERFSLARALARIGPRRARGTAVDLCRDIGSGLSQRSLAVILRAEFLAQKSLITDNEEGEELADLISQLAELAGEN